MMRTLTFTLVMCSAVAIVAAQAPGDQPKPAADPPTAQQATSPPSPAQTAATVSNKVIYAGCLKPGTASGTWKLENAEMPSTVSAQANPGDIPVGTSGAASMKRTFNLSTKAGVDLKAHENHKIEVTGTVSQASAAAAGTAPQQTLSVESFKMVSATCP
jgi:hypothetical protein